jgi:hypothetical protein
MKMSEAIRKASREGFREYRNSYSHCAIGSAYYGATGKILDDFDPITRHPVSVVAETFNIPTHVVREISARHHAGESRLVLAAMLDAGGY